MHERVNKQKQKYVKNWSKTNDNKIMWNKAKKKNVRKTPVLINFQRKEIKTQKESHVEGRQKFT